MAPPPGLASAWREWPGAQMPCEGFQSGGSGKPPSPPCQGCSDMDAALRPGREAAARQRRLEWQPCLSYRHVPGPGGPGAPTAPVCWANWGGGRQRRDAVFWAQTRGAQGLPLTLVSLRSCVCTRVCMCVCVWREGEWRRETDAGACTCVHVAHRCVCLVHLAAACAFVLVCALCLWVSVSLFVSTSTQRPCVLSEARGCCGHSWCRCCPWLVGGVSVFMA